jgi:hypothetical protein
MTEELLSQAFRDRQTNVDEEACPDNERIWDAAKGLLSKQQRRKIIDHTSTCPTCAASWRMARELIELEKKNPHKPEAEQAEVVPFQRQSKAQWYGMATIAAVLLLAIGISFFQPQPTDQPIMRSGQTNIITTQMEGQTLSRAACELQWQLAENQAQVVYQIRVTTEDIFEVLYEENNLTETRITIPAEALASVSNGEYLIWQVTASLRNGTSISASFVNRLEE